MAINKVLLSQYYLRYTKGGKKNCIAIFIIRIVRVRMFSEVGLLHNVFTFQP